MTGRVPKFLLFVNNSSHSYFVFKSLLHLRGRQWKIDYKIPLPSIWNISELSLIFDLLYFRISKPTIDRHCCACKTYFLTMLHLLNSFSSKIAGVRNKSASCLQLKCLEMFILSRTNPQSLLVYLGFCLSLFVS